MDTEHMEWRFSDGTVVRLGGVVEGDGPLALKLREDLELLPHGRASTVNVPPEPWNDTTLDPSNPLHVEYWTDDWLRFCDGVSLVSGPTLPAVSTEPSVPGLVY